MDDATVEAIAEIQDQLEWFLSLKDHHRDGLGDSNFVAAQRERIDRLLAALPDPRPTDEQVRDALVGYLRSGRTEALVRRLRDLGCFRPEPAAEPGAWLAANYRPTIEPVPAAEPPTECDDCYLLTARDAEKRGLLISDAAVMLCPQHVETVTETP